MKTFIKNLLVIAVLLITAFAVGCVNDDDEPQVEDKDVVWVSIFGSSSDPFFSVTAVPGGVVAAGYSTASSFGEGDWTGVTGKGDDDAIIVKFDQSGNVVWKKSFGGANYDRFWSVAAVSDGVIATGYSRELGTGDWTGVTAKGSRDAIMVKYDLNGNMVWKKNFGGRNSDEFSSITALSDGFVTAGYTSSIGHGDWIDLRDGGSAAIVKFDHDGNAVWKKNFGGWNKDWFLSVAADNDGLIAVGYSDQYSFGRYDWLGVTGKGAIDAIIVKYDHSGNLMWKKHFGGSGDDCFNSVTALSDGYIAVGYSGFKSFNTGDWDGVANKSRSGDDAIIVKYDLNGNLVWKKNFGGAYDDCFQSIIAVSDGIVAAGKSRVNASDNAGDWSDMKGSDNAEAILVKYDTQGNVLWKKHRGFGYAISYSVSAVADGLVATGTSHNNVKGVYGATVVKYRVK